MDFYKNTCIIILYLYVNVIVTYRCHRNCTNFIRVLEMDNLVTQGDTRISTNHIGECIKSCLENTVCVSFIFNKRQLLCILLIEDVRPTIHEEGWNFFGSARNLALKKETFQSGTMHYNEYNYDINGTSDKAVDGDSNTDFFQLSCSHTVESNTPYWYVDLGNERRIQHFGITNRGDCCAERLHDVEVTVAGPNKEFNIFCGYFKGPGTASQIVVIDCPHGMKGRYVKLQIVQGTGNFLTLCEVKVTGT